MALKRWPPSGLHTKETTMEKRVLNGLTTGAARLRRRGLKLLGAGALGVCLVTLSSNAVAQAPQANLFDQLPASIKSSRVLKMVGDSFAPYRIVGADGKTVTGLDMDLARALEPHLGVKVELTIVSNLPAMLAGIDTARYDLTTGPLLTTPEREKRYDMLIWLKSKPAFVVTTASGRKPTKLEDLCGLRIAFPAGSSQEAYAQKVNERCTAAKLPVMPLVGMSDQNTTMLAIQSGRADVTGMQLAAALYLQSVNPGKFLIQTDQTDQLGILLQGFALKKDSGLAPVLLEALKRIWASGEYARIMEKWGLAQTQAAAPLLNPSTTR